MEAHAQLFYEQAAARRVGLEPLAIDNHLRNGPFAGVTLDFGHRRGVGLDINLRVDDAVRVEKLLGGAAVAAPYGRVNLYLHTFILFPGSHMAVTERTHPCALDAGCRARVDSIVHMTADEIKTLLRLEPHPVEGGFYRRTYTSMGQVQLKDGSRALGSAIYYLLEPGTFSEMHMLASDEMFHFYLGDPVEMLQLAEDGSSAVFALGSDLEAGQHVQLLVPAGVWQGTRLVEGGEVALLGCTVTPGFDFADYHSASDAELVQKWPEQTERIRALTRR